MTMEETHVKDFLRPEFRMLPVDPLAAIRSVADLVRFNAQHNPRHLFLLQALATDEPEDGSKSIPPLSISYLHFAHVVSRCVGWLRARLPQDASSTSVMPVALLLESDARSFAFILALMWLRIPCLLLSIRLSPAAISHLASQCDVRNILVSQRTSDLAKAATDHPLDVLHVPGLDEILAPISSDTSILESLDVDENDRNVIILHSSGTTGMPKPIRLSHRYVLGYAGCHNFSKDENSHGINVSTLPLFHGFGLLAPCLALSVGMPCYLPASGRLPSGRSTLTMCAARGVRSLMTVPLILEDMLADMDSAGSVESDMATLASLDFVAVGGGGMSEALAKKFSAHGVKLLNHYGATELGALAPIFFPTKDYDWRYLRLRKDIGLELKPIEDSGTSSKPRRCRLIGYPFGWDTAFELQDDLECNPRHPESEVKIMGRKDDLIVMASGEKVHPRPLEQALTESSLVKTAMVVGSGHFELGVLVEPVSPAESPMPESKLVESIWPYVVEGNESMDGHAQITSPAALAIAPRHKHIKRTDKGSVARKETEQAFKEEIESMYQRLESSHQDDESGSLDSSNLEHTIMGLVRKCLPPHKQSRDLHEDDDIFELGIDSLQCLRLQRSLEASLDKWQESKKRGNKLQRNFPYRYNTVSKMAAAIRSTKHENTSAPREEMLRKQLHHFVNGSVEQQPQDKSAGFHVLLTGSTGSIGAHVLQQLSQDARVKSVICLLRPGNSQRPATNGNHVTCGDIKSGLRMRQQAANAQFEITLPEKSWSKIKLLEWDPVSETLGLSPQDITRLSQDITHILHCAWPMDFNRSVESFEPHIRVVQALAELAIKANKRRPLVQPRLVVLSSISAVGQYTQVTGSRLVPEEVMDDPLVTLPMGYAEAKWICEHLCQSFVKSNAGDIDPMVVRLGQISGSTVSGYWNVNEHMPFLFQVSQKIGKLPQLEGDVSWLPVDQTATILNEILLSPTKSISSDAPVLHVENPIRVPWSDVIIEMAQHLGISAKDNSLPFEEWIDLATQRGALGDHLGEFLGRDFVHMATGFVLDTTRARKVSATLQSVGGTQCGVLRRYVEYWRRAGLLP